MTPSTQETPSASSHPASQDATATSLGSKDNLTSQETHMDTTLNLKRRRYSGEGQAKNNFKAPKLQPQEQPQQEKSPTQEQDPHQQAHSYPQTYPTHTQTHPTQKLKDNMW